MITSLLPTTNLKDECLRFSPSHVMLYTNLYYTSIYKYLHFLRQNILITLSLNGFVIVILLETVFLFFCLHRNELINFSFWTKVLVRKLIAYSIVMIPFDAMNIFQWKVSSFRFTIVI